MCAAQIEVRLHSAKWLLWGFGPVFYAIPLAVGQWYDFHELGLHLGNVGLETFAESLTSAFGTKRKCHRRLATSAVGGITDIRIVVRDFRL